MTDATRRPGRPRSLSEVLSDLVEATDGAHVTLDDLLRVAGDRAFGALLFLFAVPNVLPTPPGTSAVLGVPLVLLSAQLACGRKVPWLPAILARRSIERATLVRLVERIRPTIARLETAFRPRLPWLTSAWAERAIGGVALVLAIVIFLPIPLGNVLPAAAICAFALALLEHDGIFVLLGVAVTVASAVLVGGAFYALLVAASALVQHVTG